MSGPRPGFVQDEFQPGCVFQNDAMRQFVLDLSVVAAERCERALLLFRGPNHAQVDPTLLEIGADLCRGDGEKPASGQVQFLDDFADLALDQFRDPFDSMTAHGDGAATRVERAAQPKSFRVSSSACAIELLGYKLAATFSTV